MNNNWLSTWLLGVFFTNFLIGQSLDEEIGFIYVKAEYLFETGRHEEAVANYNQVILKNPIYKEALLHRGEAKYALGAYKSTKSDALLSIELKGITHENASLLGRAASAMGEQDAAINSLSTAIMLDPKNGEYLLWRGQVYESIDQKLKACSDYELAAIAGNSEAQVKAKNYCGASVSYNTQNTGQSTNHTTNTTKNTNENIDNQTGTNHSNQNHNTDVTTTVPVSDSTTVSAPNTTTNTQNDGTTVALPDENLPKNDDTVNAFVVDDDLSLKIYGQELGHRKIKEVPSILILADENGKVCINICVNKEGYVVKAEFNAPMSTILQKSLVSLALRKAKEFEFEPGKYESQCGVMIFEIKGS